VIKTVDWRWWLAGMGLGIVRRSSPASAGHPWPGPSALRTPSVCSCGGFSKGCFSALCLPSSIGGDVVKAYRLADSTPRRILAGCTVLADRLTGLAALGVLAGAAMIAAEWSSGTGATIGTGVALLGAALAVFRSRCRIARPAADGDPGADPRGIFISQLLPYQARPTLLTHALDLEPPHPGRAMPSRWRSSPAGWECVLPMSVWFVVVPMIMLAMVVPISINGVGVREGGMAMLLAPHAVPSEQAVAIALFWFLGTIISGLFGGLLFCSIASRSTPPRGGRRLRHRRAAGQRRSWHRGSGHRGTSPLRHPRRRRAA